PPGSRPGRPPRASIVLRGSGPSACADQSHLHRRTTCRRASHPELAASPREAEGSAAELDRAQGWAAAAASTPQASTRRRGRVRRFRALDAQATLRPQMLPETRYVRLGDERIAYQTIGEGPLDLVLTWGSFSNVDIEWEDPVSAGFYRRLASFARLIRFDRRGTASSDRLSPEELPPWESYVQAMTAGLHAVGSPDPPAMGVFD